MSLYKKSLRIIGSLFVVYAFLVATHRGEFWPFSIYPMFSQAGPPWTRALVREVPMGKDHIPKDTVSLSELPGSSFPVAPEGINQNDVANYVSKTETWSTGRVEGLRSLFTRNESLETSLLIYRVRGRLLEDSVQVRAIPVLFFAPDSTYLHPSLDTD